MESTNTPAIKAAADERALFVKTMKEIFGEDENFDRDESGRYINRAWQDAYVGWIHRAALATPAIQAVAPIPWQDIVKAIRDGARGAVLGQIAAKLRKSVEPVSEDKTAEYRYFHGGEVSEDKRDAEPVIVCDWDYCNPACEYEDPHGGMHDCRSKGCTCDQALASIARQTATTPPTKEST